MAAASHAYDDLTSVYAAEISPIRHGVLLTLRRCGDTMTFDRKNNRRPSLSEYNLQADDPQASLVLNISDPETRRELPAGKSAADIRRAARNGGAANKARWARIKALKEAA